MKSLTHCVYEMVVLIGILFVIQDACGVDVEHDGVKYFMGYRRAPLPYPYQLVVRNGMVSLCDHNGCASVLNVNSVGYDEEYVYALGADGSFSLLHLYDEYVEKYENEMYLPECMRTMKASGLVKMIDAMQLVNAFQNNGVPANRNFSVGRKINKDIYGKSKAKSPFLPVDLTVIVKITTNGVPQRIVRKFQNCTFSKTAISCIECEMVAPSKVSFRMVEDGQGKESFCGWTALPLLTYPIEIPAGGKFEICVERENVIPPSCFELPVLRNIMVKMNAQNGGGSILRVGEDDYVK